MPNNKDRNKICWGSSFNYPSVSPTDNNQLFRSSDMNLKHIFFLPKETLSYLLKKWGRVDLTFPW